MSDFLERIARLSPGRIKLLALELQDKLDAVERRTREPIAVVGMACRLPGGVSSPEAYWQLMRDGVDAIAEIPPSRWNAADYYDRNGTAPGKMSTRWGGFIDDVELFDAGLFGIAPREAVSLDPQQRLLLETSWEALEHAGHAPDRLRGTSTGVFVGIGTSDYSQLLTQSRPLSEVDGYRATGCISHSPASGRIAYVFGLQGPAVSVDTACSSSLSAVHLACQSLRLDECRMALVGGVNVVLMPELTISLSKAGMMASDGRCKTFAAAADGFVRGEGCGVVVLKRLSAAQADGDRILAVIRGSALNQDGRSNGLTAPNGPAQEAVIREALDRAGVQPHEVSFVETHGTGTELGDPIEVQALASVLCRGRSASDPLQLGSVKTNIGHIEAAAGIAGFIKLVLAIQHREIPPNLHFDEPNPYIPWSEYPLEVPTTLRSWAPASGRRVGSVSSFGFSGTNAHVIAEAGPAADVRTAERARPLHVLTLSARSESALDTLIGRYADHLAASDSDVADVCFTANAGRAQLSHRVALVGRTSTELHATLADLRRGGRPHNAFRSEVRSGYRPRVAMLFTGQGAQYAGMARGLYDTQPTFRGVLERCDALLRGELEVPLLDVLYGSGGDINATAYAQPAIFALEVALAELWKSWGVEPSTVLGHSVGEYVAAHVAGVLSLEEGLRLIAARGRLMGALPAGGSMAAVLGPISRVAALVRATPGTAVAAVNGPEAVTVAGDTAAVEVLRSTLRREGIESQPLAVSHAFHSARMDPMLDAFESIARSVRWQPPRIGVVSNVTGRVAAAGELSEASYWRRHAREPVQFDAGMRTLAAIGCDVVIEVGPHPVLTTLGQRCVAADTPDARTVTWGASLARGREDWSQILETLSRAWLCGVPVDWAGVDRDYPRSRVALPTYPFQRHRYWVDTPLPELTSPAGQVSAVPDSSHAACEAFLASNVYGVEWERSDAALHRRDLSAGDEAQVGTPHDLLNVVRPAALASAQAHDLDVYARIEPELNRVCGGLAHAALVELGWGPAAGERFTTGELAAHLRVLPRHRRLLERMLGMLREDGVLTRAGMTWEVLRDDLDRSAGAALALLRERYPSCAAELTLLGRCGGALASVLSGRIDPLQLLFPDGSSADLEAVYARSPAALVHNGMLRDIVMREAADRQGRIRILEIGAGTGATTAELVPRLHSRHAEYVVTDVSSFFVTQAAQRWAGQPWVRTQIFDVDVAPAAQGLDDAQFDVVIAANVLHATRDIEQTLAHVSRVMAPGALLVLWETVRAERWIDLVFGLTEGWWRFADVSRRPEHPLVSEREWQALLEQSGMPGAAAWTAGQSAANAVIVARRPESAVTRPGRWLILGDESGVGSAVAARLSAAGHQAHLVGAGESPASEARTAEQVRELMAALPQDALPFAGVIHTRALDVDASPDLPARDVVLAQTGLGESLVAVVAVLGEQRGSTAPRLWLVTRGAQPAGDGSRSSDALPRQAAVWGWGRTLRLEQPQLWGGLIDLDPQETREAGDQVVTSMFAPDGEDQCAWRSGGRLLPRLARITPAAGQSRVALRGDATYVVTGGLGRVGLEVAAWLVDRGARHLALIGRTGLIDGTAPDAAERTAAVERLRGRGIDVQAIAADVADAAQVAALFSRLAQSGAPVRGVVHAAGVLTSSPMAQLDREAMAAMFRVKVGGAENLHRQTRGLDLDLFVLFSSSLSVLGWRGLAHYAAANQYLDGLAHQRRAQGLPALAIDWGRWDVVSRMMSETGHQWLDAQGMRAFSPAEGLAAMERLLAGGAVQATVAAIEPRLFQHLAAAAPGGFLSRVLPREGAGAPEAPSLRSTGTRQGPLASGAGVAAPVPTAVADGEDGLEAYVRTRVAHALGVASGELDVTEPINALGLDSIMALQLKNRFETELGVTVSVVSFLTGHSVREMAVMLERRRDEQRRAGTMPDTVSAPSEMSELVTRAVADPDELSEAEVDLLLSRFLSSDVN